MIPKIIHYCWFGGKPLPKELEVYINSWKVYCPDYEIKIWNESTFDVDSHLFTKSAYEARKFAYVSDYVRAYALFNEGGIYLDTDVELKQNIDIFLEHEAFSGFEAKGLPFTALWGSTPGHSMAKKVLNYYENREYKSSQETNTASVSELLVSDFNINPNFNALQIGFDGTNYVHIYPAEYFCLDILPNYACHHFAGSWIDRKTSQKQQIHSAYYSTKLLEGYKKNNISVLKGIAYALSFEDIVKLSAYSIYYKFIPKSLKKLFK